MTTPPQIVVYGRPGCQQCRMTTGRLDKHGLPYAYRDVTEDPAAHEVVTALGYQSLPVVVVGDMHWSGFRLSKLDRLVKIHAAAPDVAGLESAAVEFLTDGDAA
jgi:glutaredoxin-like protein NrdH